jgi:DNA-binding NtrC family response regulator
MKTVLVVDDEAQIRELLSIYLRRQGYDVHTASSSSETISCLAARPVDIVVLDIGLAQEDGLKLLEHLKNSYPGVRVVMLTGMGFVEDLLQEAHDKGADGYVSKVLPLDELLIAIERASEGPAPLAA